MLLSDDMMAKVVRLNIGDLCRERKWSPNDLAREAGITPLTARNLIRGNTERIDLVTMTKVCNALGVDPGSLFSYSEDDRR
jgi:DNA-binding Xre family transcriptional regulator